MSALAAYIPPGGGPVDLPSAFLILLGCVAAGCGVLILVAYWTQREGGRLARVQDCLVLLVSCCALALLGALASAILGRIALEARFHEDAARLLDAIWVGPPLALFLFPTILIARGVLALPSAFCAPDWRPAGRKPASAPGRGA